MNISRIKNITKIIFSLFYLNKYSMLLLLEDTIPLARTSSLWNPRKVKLIGTVQHLTSRPVKQRRCIIKAKLRGSY